MSSPDTRPQPFQAVLEAGVHRLARSAAAFEREPDVRSLALTVLALSSAGAAPPSAAVSALEALVLPVRRGGDAHGSGVRRRDATSVDDLEDAAWALAALGAHVRDLGSPTAVAAIDRTISFVLGAQSDGGAFRPDTGAPRPDGEAAGLVGLVLFGLGNCGFGVGDPQVRRAAGWLRRRQRENGGFSHGTASSIIDTSLVVLGLGAAGEDPASPALARACSFLAARQREDGAWVDGAEITSPVTSTALALLALSVARVSCPAKGAAASWLASVQERDGSWPRNPAGGDRFGLVLNAPTALSVLALTHHAS